jgi:hypothetical protein
MRKWTLIGLLVLVLGACANSGTTAQQQPFVTVVGTPFLIAFKIPVCATTIALAGPGSALATLTDKGPDRNYAEASLVRDFDYGLNNNCGPPYVVTP